MTVTQLIFGANVFVDLVLVMYVVVLVARNGEKLQRVFSPVLILGVAMLVMHSYDTARGPATVAGDVGPSVWRILDIGVAIVLFRLTSALNNRER